MAGTHRTRSPRLALAALALATALPASAAFAQDAGALPQDGRVVAGNATLSTGERNLTVHQRSARAILEWRSFDIGRDASVQFLQPSTSSVALNRVTGGDASRIAGQLKANGHVYLVNGAGVLVGKGAQVDVGNLVLSTLDIADGDFLTGRFDANGGATLGPASGPSTLPPPRLELPLPPAAQADGRDADTGAPTAPPARQLTMEAGADGHLRIGVQPAQIQSLIDDGGLVDDGDGLMLTAHGASALGAAVVAEDGVPQARAVALRDGRLMLLAAAAPVATPDAADGSHAD